MCCVVIRPRDAARFAERCRHRPDAAVLYGKRRDEAFRRSKLSRHTLRLHGRGRSRGYVLRCISLRTVISAVMLYSATPLVFNSPVAGVPWDDVRTTYQMHRNIAENFNLVSSLHDCYRQTDDRQTDELTQTHVHVR